MSTRNLTEREFLPAREVDNLTAICEPVVYKTGLQRGVCENILRNRLNLEPALILALTKILPRIEVLACQKPAQSSH
jgi:hypothetical protein